MRVIARMFLVTMWVSVLGGCSAIATDAGGERLTEDGRTFAEAERDSRISAQITRLMVQDEQLKATDIRVATREGVVSIVGTVPDTNAVRRAIRIAASVPGVRWVREALKVQEP